MQRFRKSRSRRSKMRVSITLLWAACGLVLLTLGSLWAYAGAYGLNVVFRHGGTFWVSVGKDSPRLSPSMRLALADGPTAMPGDLIWHPVATGFEVADLPALVDGKAVDHLLLARIDPAHYRFEARNASNGDKNLDQWMAQLGVSLIVNGSYYDLHGRPDTPFLSNGLLLGPKDYDAKAGAFVSAPGFTGIRDLSKIDWKEAFSGAQTAMVSYPLLVANGKAGVVKPSRWLANRSFVGQDATGQIIIGTTTDAFFSLDRLAQFLLDAPIGLTLVLNLDGGPVASQGISLNGFDRRTNGRWEVQVEGDRVELLTWPYGTIAMPIVLAVFPR